MSDDKHNKRIKDTHDKRGRVMSIKTLVKEHIRIEEADRKIRQRRFRLQDKLDKTDSGIQIIDGVVWKIESGYGRSKQIIRVGEVDA